MIRYALLALLSASGCASTQSGAGPEGARYEAMKRYAGEWDETVTWTKRGVDKPLQWRGRSSNEMIGRRWMAGRHTANFLGSRYESNEILGFDEVDNRWVAVWIDRLTDHHLFMEGQPVDSTTLVLKGGIRSRDTGAMVPFKRSDRWLDDDTLEVKWTRMSADGQIEEEFTILQTRSKKPHASVELPR